MDCFIRIMLDPNTVNIPPEIESEIGKGWGDDFGDPFSSFRTSTFSARAMCFGEDFNCGFLSRELSLPPDSNHLSFPFSILALTRVLNIFFLELFNIYHKHIKCLNSYIGNSAKPT